MNRFDILLVHARFDPLVYFIRKVTKSNWNHCALIIDNNRILDPTSNRIKIKSINSYSNKLFYKTKIVKIKDFNFDEKIAIIKRAYELEHNFKFEWHKFLISLIQIYLKKRPIKDTCSGLIAKLLKECCFISFDKPYYFMTPEDFNKIGE